MITGREQKTANKLGDKINDKKPARTNHTEGIIIFEKINFMFKRISVLIIIIALTSCNTTDKVNENIYILYANFDIQTIINVRCDEFEKVFKNRVKIDTIKKGTIDYQVMKSFYSELEVDTDLFPTDVRVKIVFKETPEKSIYMDAFGHFYSCDNGKQMKNYKLYNYIKKIAK